MQNLDIIRGNFKFMLIILLKSLFLKLLKNEVSNIPLKINILSNLYFFIFLNIFFNSFSE